MSLTRRRRRAVRIPYARMNLERLEDRTLLDGATVNANILAAQRDGMLTGLQGLTDWSGTLAAFNRLAQPITLVNQKIGEALNFTDTLQRGLKDPIATYFAGDSTPTTDELVTALRNLTRTYTGNLEVTVNHASVNGGIITPARDEIHFHLNFQAVRTLTVPVALGSSAAETFGISLDAGAAVTLRASLNFELAFGYDLSSGLTPAQAFFIRPGTFTAGATVNVTNLNTTAKVGVLSVQVQNASINLNASLAATFINPDSDYRGNLTLAELQGTTLTSLISLSQPAASLTAAFPVRATFGGWTAAGTPTINVTSSNVFSGSPPAVSFNADFGELHNFARATPADFTGLFAQLGASLQNAATNLNPSAALPFVNRQLNQLMDLTRLTNRVARPLYEPVVLANQAGPADGRISTNAIFQIKLNDAAPITVTVNASSTQYNSSLDHLVNNLNAALPYGLAGVIRATRAGDRIRLTAIAASVTQFSVLIADPSNPAAREMGFAPGQSSTPSFKFTTVQELVPLLAAAMGVSESVVSPQYDAATHALRFTLNFSEAGFSRTLPLDFGAGVGPVKLLASANANFAATIRLNIALGIDLAALVTVLTGEGDAPTNGRLSSDAHFSLAIGTATPVDVTVPARPANTTLDQLVGDINAALGISGLSGRVTAGRSGNRITLSTNSTALLQVRAVVGNTALTELRLPTTAAGPNWARAAFLAQNGTVTAQASLSATNFSASAGLGILSVGVSGGNVSVTADTGLRMNTPRVTLEDLLRGTAGSITVQPVVANATGRFPLVVSGVNLGITTQPVLDLALATPNNLASLTVTPNAAFNNFLGGFQNFALGNFTDVLRQVVSMLDAGSLGAFNARIPLLNKSVNELLQIGTRLTNSANALDSGVNLGTALTNLRTAITGLPSTLAAELFDAFGRVQGYLEGAAYIGGSELAAAVVTAAGALSDVINRLPGGVDRTALNAVLTALNNATPSVQGLATRISAALGLTGGSSFTLEWVNANPGGFERALVGRLRWLPTTSHTVSLNSLNIPSFGPLTVSGTGNVTVTLGGDLQLDFGFNLRNPGAFLLDSSAVRLTGWVDSRDLTLTAALGGVNVSLGRIGDPVVVTLRNAAGTGAGALAVTLTQRPRDGTHIGQYTFAQVPGALQFSGVDARFNATLPLYFAGSGLGNLTVSYNLSTPATPPVVTPPADLAARLAGQDFNFTILVTGINAFLGALQAGLQSNVVGKLPIVGKDLNMAGGFIQQLRDRFVTPLTATLADGALGTLVARVRQVLFDNLGAGTAPGLNILHTALPCTEANRVTDPSQIDVSVDTAAGEVRINPVVCGTSSYTAGFNLGLDGLPFKMLQLTGGAQIGLTYGMHLGFGISKTQGFFFTVRPAGQPTATFSATVGLTPGTRMDVNLFLIKLRAESNGTTGITANLGIEFPSPGGRLYLPQMAASIFNPKFTASATAEINLRLTAATALDAQLPSISADFVASWTFASGVGISEAPRPSVALRNITLQLGSAFSKIFGPILSDLNRFMRPIRPIITLLNTEVPVISTISRRVGGGPIYFRDAFRLFGSGGESVSKALGVIGRVDGLLQMLTGLSTTNIGINFGDFQFNVDLRNPQTYPARPQDLGSIGSIVSSFAPAAQDGQIAQGIIDRIMASTDPRRAQARDTLLNMNSAAQESSGFGFRFPIFQNPLNAVGILFGQAVTLVEWDVPRLSAEWSNRWSFGPVWAVPPVFITVGGGIKVDFHITLGFDTRGLQTGRFFDGFHFVKNPDPVLNFQAEVTGGAEVSVIIVSAGAEVGLRGVIGANWNDPNRDGKIYLDELKSNLDRGIECIFDISGGLFAFLRVYVSFGIWPFKVTLKWQPIPALKLFSFEHSCPPLPPPEPAHISTGTGGDAGIPAGTLILHTGRFATLRQPGYSRDTEETVSVRQVGPGKMEVHGFGQVKEYGTDSSPILGIYGDGGAEDDDIRLESSGPERVTVPATLRGGAGNDQLTGGAARNYLVGGGGNDVLAGGPDADLIEAGVGNASIYGSDGNDTITAAGGDNYIEGGDGDDLIQGGTGGDYISGGRGNDTIRGGGGPDQIFGEEDNDLIVGEGASGIRAEGGPGLNHITGSDGPDLIFGDREGNPSGPTARSTVFGSAGNDTIYGAAGVNELHGGADHDSIQAGPAGDSVFGDGGNDVIEGGQGHDTVRGGSGNDRIRGYAGNDLIWTDDGDDTAYGGTGLDTITGGSGRQVLIGDQGIDRIYAGTGSYYIDGSEDNDFIYGGMSLTGSTVLGGSGDDYIVTGQGPETFYGGVGDDLLVQTVDGNQGLNNTAMTGRGTKTHYTVERFLMTGGPSGNAFDFSGFTGVATVVGAGGPDRVTSTDNVDFTLVDGHLSKSDGGRVWLVGITHAVLTGGVSDNAFDITRWTGTGYFDGGAAHDWIVAVNDADFTVGAATLTRSTGGSFTFANLEGVRVSGGPSNNRLDASGFTGNASLYGGAGNDTLLGGSGDDYLDGGPGVDWLDGGAGGDVLVARASASATLLGGAGDDVIHGSDGGDDIQGGAGHDRIYGNAGADFIQGGAGADTVDGGTGNDTVHGDAGPDLLLGGAGNDVLYSFNPGAGDDGAVNYVYGDFGTNANEAGTGNDMIAGGTGNDLLFGEGGTNSITGGGPGAIINNLPTGTASAIPPVPVPAPADWPPVYPGAATLPAGADGRGRWTEFAGSATLGGLSNSPGLALEPSIAAGSTGQYVAWADNRGNPWQIYVARHTASGWQQLAGSAQFGGISGSAPASPARRPSIAMDVSGQPMVAWTGFSGGASDIYLARYDSVAGAWLALGGSLGAGGISGTGAADNAVLVITPSGPVVAWIDRSAGAANVYAKQFNGSAWVALGTGGASGGGVSASASDVRDLVAAVDSTKVAVAWTQQVGGLRQIYLREYNGGTWNALAGSASGNGLSNTPGVSQTPSLAYLGGLLYAAYQTNTAGAVQEIYAQMFNGTAWVPAGIGAATEGGVSRSSGESTRPVLSAGGGRLYLGWLDNRVPNFTGNATALYVKRWSVADGAFVEELPGDASHRGIGLSVGSPQTPALSVDSAGRPFVAWNDLANGKPQVYVRGNLFTINRVFYVNDGSRLSDAFSTATGNNANSGTSPGQPKASIQGVLDAYTLQAGDVILVDAGVYPDSLILTAAHSGVLIFGSPSGPAIFGGTVAVTGASGIVLSGLTFQGNLLLTNTTNVTVADSQINGNGVTVSGGTGVHVVHNVVTIGGTGVHLTNGTAGAVVEHNIIRGGTRGIAVTGTGGATGFEMRGNRISGSGIGIALLVAASGHIGENEVGFAGTALEVAAAFTGLIEKNDLHHSSTGLRYLAAARVNLNRIHHNATGVVNTVNSATDGFGLVSGSEANEIYENTVGVNLTGLMHLQHIFSNSTGVTGSGRFVSTGLETANVIELNNVGVDFVGTIQFQRIARNTTGVLAKNGQLLAHNLIYRNTVHGIHVRGVTDVRIFHNTLYSPTGDLIRVENNASVVELRNNILWVGGGYGIYVANDSISGFFSDYNLLHATGTGKLVWWTKDFTDLLDWQEDVYRFDLHSLGYTVVNPDWSNPRFMALSLNDYRVFDPQGRLRYSSPTIDTGDPLADQSLPASYRNLLANPEFESNLTGWSVTPSGGIRTANPAPWEGGRYFFAGPIPVATIEQTIDLIAAGYTVAQLDGQNMMAVFGGRVRSALEGPRDAGTITLAFLDGAGNVLREVTARAANTADRWELIGGRNAVPAGTRRVRFRFTAVRNTGGDNDAYLDGAFLTVHSNSVAPNLGAYGNTPAEDAQFLAQHLVLRSPDLYRDWERDKPLTIRWDSFGNVANAPVRIDLYQDSANGPRLIRTLAASTADTGEFTWIPSTHDIAYATYGLRIQISLIGNVNVLDRAAETFTVPENTNTFYVNDASTTNDEYTTVRGSNRNTGKLSSAPKPYPNNVLRIYALGPTQTLYVDTGEYPLLSPLVISAIVGVGDDRAFTMTGPTGAGRAATLRHANPFTVAPVIELYNAHFTTLSRLTIRDGQMGVWAHDGSRSLTLTYLDVRYHTLDGIRVEADSGVTDLGFVTAFANGRYGIFIDSPVGRLHDSTITFNADTGLYLNNVGAALVEANLVANNRGYGVYVANWVSGTTTVIGNPDVALGRGNRVLDNTRNGIYAYNQVQVAGNTVAGHTSLGNFGVFLLNGAQAVRNVVHGNYRGIHVQNGGVIRENRVYNNAEIGVHADYATPLVGNVIYSNGTGVYLGYYFSGSLENNLIYANAARAILLQGAGYYGSGLLHFVNNTIYQPTGDGIRVEGNSRNVRLRNNVIWTLAGIGVSVADDSQLGFVSDFNLLYATGTGQVGLWQGVGRSNLTNWRNAVFQDQNSVGRDPLFISVTGADGFLGYQSAVNDGRDDDFHEKSLHGSYKGGALAPVINLATGVPVYVTPALSTDTQQSPAIDRGDPTDGFANEPASHGNFVNLGVYGNTAQGSKSPAQYVLVTAPEGGEVWPMRQTFPVRWRTQDLNRYGLSFNGTNQYVQTGATAVMQARPLTLEAWVRPELRADGTDFPTNVLSNDQPGQGGHGFGVNVWAAGSQLKVQYSGGFRVVPGASFTAGQWYHVAVVYISGNVKTYVNGSLADDFSFTQGTQTGTNLIRVGIHNHDSSTYGTRRFFKGTLDEVRVWSAARTLADIQANRARLLDGTEAGLAAYYRLDEGRGLTALDRTALAAHGTLSNAYLETPPVWVSSTVPIGITAKLDLMRDGITDPVLTIAASVPNNGEYLWQVPQGLTAANNYRVRVTRIEAGSLSGISVSPFTINVPISVYYVNDATFQAGDWTTAAGNDANNGLTAATPLPSIQAVLSRYQLSPGDVIRVDNGSYNLTTNLILTAAQAGVKIEGYHDVAYPTRRALLNRGNVSGGSYAVELRGASDVTLDYLHITGAEHGVYAANGSRSLRVTVSNSTVYGNNVNGIWLDGTNDFATITGNRVYGIPGGAWQDDQDTGIAVAGADATIARNTVFDHPYYSGIWVRGLRAQVRDNTIYQNTVGIDAAGGSIRADRIVVAGNTARNNTRDGIAASSAVLVTGNTVHNNQTGINAYYSPVEVVDNTAYANVTGVYGSNDALVQGNRTYNNTGAGLSAGNYNNTFVGNTSYGNRWGLVVTYYFNGRIANNLLYSNTERGALVQAGYNYGFDFVNNTVYQTAGDGIRLENSRNVRLRNNIIWVQAGYALAVDPNSEVGFRSDYNDLYATGTGNVAQWATRTFATRADWFYEVGHDAHSLSVNPRFVNPAGGDFHLQSDSPAIDRGDPNDTYANEPRPHGGRVNLGNYGNTSEAATSPSQLVQVLSPSGLEKLQIGQTIPVTWRTAGLFAPAGYYRDTILADTPHAYYRLGESGGTSASDTSGQGRHGTYAGGVRLDQPGALPADQDTAAFFDGTDDHVSLPTGFADFRTGFTAEMWAYPTAVNNWQRFFELGNGAYSDNILLARNGTTNGLIFQAYNGSSGGAQVIAPNAIELNKWQHFAVTLSATGQVTLYKNGVVIGTGTTNVVRNIARTRNYLGRSNFGDPNYAGALDEAAFYSQVLPAARIQAHYARSVYGTVNIDLMRAGDPPTLVRNLATGVPNTGSFNWTIPGDLALGSDFLVRVRANEGALPQGFSGENFLVANGGNRYYVNDGATASDVFTTAVGNNANSGKTPDQPLASLPALLSAYSLQAGDTVFVDTGNYNLIRNVVLEARHAGVRIQGPSSTVALFNRGNVSNGSYVFELRGASDVTLDRLSITGAEHGVYASNTSRSLRVTVSNSTLYGNNANGIWLDGTNDFATITGNRLYGIPGGPTQDDQDTGIAVAGNDATVRNNTVFDHPYYAGIWVRGARSQVRDNLVYQNAVGIDASAGVSRADRIVVTGNTTRNNAREGIAASSAVLVTGNTTHNNQTGISAYYSPAEVVDNTVYANTTGIYGSNDALIQGNRTYNNTGAGLSAGNYGTAFVGNTSYGNRWGVVVSYYFSGRIANNLLYSNTERGALVQAGYNYGFDFINNTVYQTAGDAVRIESSRNVRLRNNILVANTGYVLHVDSVSQVGFRSDYNLFRAAGTAKLGAWQGRDFMAHPTWFYETGQDVHSLVTDPAFVNPAAGDFHLQSASPAIDRGDPNDAYASEPRPHGGRVNLGNYGNTSEATTSAAQAIHVLGPTGLEKLQAGQTVPVTWRTSGVYAPAGHYRDAILADTPHAYYRLGETSGTAANDASGQGRHGTYAGGVRLDNPGALPADLDASAFLGGAEAHVQLPTGFADFRTGFTAEVWAYPTVVGRWERFFELGNGPYSDNLILAREGSTNNLAFQAYNGGSAGTLVIAPNAIELNKWQHFAITLSATGQVTLYKNGLVVGTGTTNVARNITRTRNYLGRSSWGDPSYIGALDEAAFYSQVLPAARIQAHYARSAYGTVNIDLMRAGSPPTLVRNLATGLPNTGSFNWTIPSDLPPGNNYLIRVQASEGTQPQGLSPEAFLVTNGGNRYYVNDGATAGDIYTTAVGNNANSGKAPDQPMANLATLLAAYNLQAGDTVYVDAGNYDLLRNVIVTARHAGVTIQGAGATAVLNRGLVTTGSYVFEFQNTARVTLNRLGVRGGYHGVYAGQSAPSTELTVSNSTVFGNYDGGIFFDYYNDRATLVGNTLYGIPGGSGDDNQSYGINVSSNDNTVANNTAYDHAYTGIITRGARTTLSGNNAYGNRTGMAISGTGTVVRDNLVHDNIQSGLEVSSGGIRAFGNVVYGQTAVNAVGLTGWYDVELTDNVVHTNYTGIYASNGAVVRRNRVYNSTQIGISLGNYYNLVDSNRIYSNRVGIATSYYFGGTISNNVLYANTNQGILFQSSYGYYSSDVWNNTIYQPVGDGVRLQASPNIRLRNNLIWVQAGYTLNVDAGSQSGFSSDRNLLHKGTDPNAHIGFWGGVTRTDLAAWRAASGQDAGSVSADPLFVDLDGADNVLGFARVGETFRDGGPDDNFYLRKNSPAIDRGQSWGVPSTDVEGLPRRDDPGTANTGTNEYFGTTLGSSQFAATGTARNWRSDGNVWALTLPFAFPFYDASYTTVQVSTEGLLQFDRPGNEYAGDGVNSTAKLYRSRRIAPLWDNLHTYGTGNDIFVDTTVSGQVKIRWNATNQADNSNVNFAVVLFSDGRIRFDYGPGNTNLTPTVGISYGNNLNAQVVAGHDGAASLTNANSVEFERRPGITDIGAFEFRGSSLDVTPPRVTATEPAVIHGGGSAPQVYQIRVTFSEELNTLDATAPAAYELRKAGSGGFGSPDDIVYSLTPRYTPGSTVVTLDVNSLPGRLLPTGTYRLTIYSNATTSIHDLAGLRLDGMNTGTEGGNYVRVFSLIEARADLAVSMTVDRPQPLEGSTVRFTATLDNNGPHAATRVELRDVLPAGLTFVSATPSVGVYNRTTGIWTVDSLASAGRATLVLTATVNAGTLGQTLTNTATVTQLDQLDPTSANNTASAAVIVQPAVATRFVVSGFPSPITAGTAGTITVSAQDVYGNVITGYRGTVHLTSTDGQAVLPADYTFVAGDNGVKTLSVALLTAGVQEITVTDTVTSSLTGSQTDIQVDPAAASQLVLIAPETTRAGDPMELLVIALDPYGNLATGYQGTVTFATTDPQGGILPVDTTFTEVDGGVAFFADVYLFTAGIQTITVTDTLDGSLTWAADVFVVPTDPAFFYVEAPLEVYASVPFDLLVVVFDAYGNVVSEYTGTVTFTSTDPGAVLPSDYTFAVEDGGVVYLVGATTLFTEGEQEIIVTDLTLGIEGRILVNVLPSPGPGSGPNPPGGQGKPTAEGLLRNGPLSGLPAHGPDTPAEHSLPTAELRANRTATATVSGIALLPHTAPVVDRVFEAEPIWFGDLGWLALERWLAENSHRGRGVR